MLLGNRPLGAVGFRKKILVCFITIEVPCRINARIVVVGVEGSGYIAYLGAPVAAYAGIANIVPKREIGRETFKILLSYSDYVEYPPVPSASYFAPGSVIASIFFIESKTWISVSSSGRPKA